MRFSLAICLTTALALSPVTAFAVGSDDDTPPQPTNTTETCENGQIWDEDSEACVDADDARLDDDARFGAAREFAYAGHPLDAQSALMAMSDQSEDRVQTYWGFTSRALGDWELAEGYYQRALQANPDNLLARAYYGMGLIEQGQIEAARLQLVQIWERGGEGSWPEYALHRALTTGQTTGY